MNKSNNIFLKTQVIQERIQILSILINLLASSENQALVDNSFQGDEGDEGNVIQKQMNLTEPISDKTCLNTNHPIEIDNNFNKDIYQSDFKGYEQSRSCSIFSIDSNIRNEINKNHSIAE